MQRLSARSLIVVVLTISLGWLGPGDTGHAAASSAGANSAEQDAPRAPKSGAERLSFELGAAALSLPRDVDAVQVKLHDEPIFDEPWLSAHISGGGFTVIVSNPDAGHGDVHAALKEITLDDVIDALVKEGYARGPAKLEVEFTYELLMIESNEVLFKELFGTRDAPPKEGASLRENTRRALLEEAHAIAWKSEGPLYTFDGKGGSIIAVKRKRPSEPGGVSMVIVGFNREGESEWDASVDFSPESAMAKEEARLGFIAKLVGASE